jgi:hypothetical protein
MKTANRQPFNRAFTQVELLAVLAALLIPAFLLFPSFPRTRCKGSRIGCVNNLKQIGLAYRMWSNENGEKFPWAISSTNQNGGTLEFSRTAQAWRHFEIISNEIASPKIFKCPSDPRSKTANWLEFTNNAHLSYFAGLDADETRPQTILSGDRNLKSTLPPRNGILRLTMNTPAVWTEAIHNRQGNIGLGDGSVQQTTSNSLNLQLQAALSVTPNRLVIRLAIPE